MIFVEDLKISNMSASARGTIENPGRNIRQKSGLNRSILDQAWAMFFEFLGYKQQWNGGWVIAVPPQYTSQTCPCCSFKHADNRKTQSVFKCIECGYENNADVVASMNIEAKGIKLFEFEGQDTVDASTGCESIAQIACVVNGAIKPSAAGTRRSKSQKTANVAVGIPVVSLKTRSVATMF
jgi:putative transposase